MIHIGYNKGGQQNLGDDIKIVEYQSVSACHNFQGVPNKLYRVHRLWAAAALNLATCSNSFRPIRSKDQRISFVRYRSKSKVDLLKMSGTTMMTFSGGAHRLPWQAPAKVPQSRENGLPLGKEFRYLLGFDFSCWYM